MLAQLFYMMKQTLCLIGLLLSMSASAEPVRYSGLAKIDRPLSVVSSVRPPDVPDYADGYSRYKVDLAGELNVSIARVDDSNTQIKIGNAVILVENVYLRGLESADGRVKLARSQMVPLQQFDLELAANNVTFVSCEQGAESKTVKQISLTFSKAGKELAAVTPSQVAEAKNCGTNTIKAEAPQNPNGDATGIREQ